jgi:hypothetical protein
MFQSLSIRILFIALLITSLATAQDLSVRVQVNRLPDGHYPTKIYQFNTTPGLVLITLTNLTQSARTVYLAGKMTGDNGVLVATPPNFRPASTIDLAPMTTKTLNAIEAPYLFDPNNLVYLNGSASIKSSVFGEQGLPEGTYQLCIRAVDATTRQPLSEDEPIGCSNIFFVSTLEDPVILFPYDQEPVRSQPVQNIPIRWTTPPGAPPSTQYTLRIVEVFGQRNPYDAILSTPTPFFETTVMGSPLFLYGIQQPQMQEGRTYALMVTATDPTGGGTFRNGGHSEVVEFTYGGPNAVGGSDQGGQTQTPSLQYADHSLSGRLLWAFKKSESAPFELSTRTDIYVLPSAANSNMSREPSPFVTSTISPTAFNAQLKITPLVAMSPIAAVNSDPSLKTAPASLSMGIAPFIPATTPQLPLPYGIASGSGASSVTCTYASITVDSATERFPLPGVSVTLKAITTGLSGTPVLLATGQTGKDGKFTLQFLDPAYTGKGATRLILSITSADFESSSFDVPLNILDNTSADLGDHLLLAKTLRCYPKIDFDANTPEGDNGYGIHIYRLLSEQQARPWLANEGQIGDAKRPVVTVDGSQMVELVADTIPPSVSSNNKLTRTISTLIAKGGGRLFFGGNLYVKLIPASSDYNPVNSFVSIVNAPIPGDKVLQATLDYAFTHKPSQISGQVSFPLGAQGRLPVQGSQVRVLYKTGDGAGGNNPNLFAAVSKTPLLAATTSTGTGQSALQKSVFQIAATGLYTPLLAQGSGNNTKLTQAVQPSLLQLIDPNPVPDGYSAVTATTDDLGNYVAILPRLHQNAVITVEVINTPSDFSRFLIQAQGYDSARASITLDSGSSKIVNFDIKGDVADVVGRVVDDQGKPLANARIDFKGTTLGATGPDGLFEFSMYPGTHTLTLDKEGYVVKSVNITVPQLTNNSQNNSYSNKWLALPAAAKQTATLTRINTSQTVQASITRGNSFSAGMFGFAASAKAVNNSLAAAFGVGTASPGSQYETPQEFALDLKDIGYLNKIVGKARFRVVEAGTNNPIAGAAISIFDSTHVTDEKGEWYYEGFGGNATITLLPPKSTPYIAEQNSIDIVESGVEQVIVLTMDKGILISGTVSSNGQPLATAEVFLDGQDFGGVTTDALGHYSVYTTPGAHTVGARLTGYVGSEVDAGTISTDKTINLILKGGGGHNYSTLLGFAIELDNTVDAGGGQEKWTGNFVQLKTIDNSVFGLSAGSKIPFSNLVVSFDGSGNAQPAGGAVKTDLTQLPLKLFGYLPANLTGPDVVTFTQTTGGHGQLSGKISIDFASIQGYRGWSVTGASAQLAKTGSTTPVDITVATSVGAVAADQSFGLSGSVTGQVYGFTVTLNGATINTDGLEFSGSIATPKLDPIASINIPVTKLAIDRALSVSAVLLRTDGLPTMAFSSWTASLQNLVFNEDGFKVGGSIALNLIKSNASSIDFSNLTIGNTSIFGGAFNLPDAGVDMLGLADLIPAGSSLSFGRVGTSSVYHLTGKANLKINVEIFKAPLDIPAFEIQTNGDFNVQMKTDNQIPVGPFTFALTNLVINSKDNTPSIIVQGKFNADLPYIKFEVGEINIRPLGGKPVFSIGKVGASLDVPVVKVGLLLGFNNDGFEGEGSLSIPATPISGKVSFKYYKHPTGIELGASFYTDIPPLPIGGIVTLEGIGGGFSYTDGGPNGGFMVDIKGKVSMFGAGALVAISNIDIQVQSAGILTGHGDLVVADYLKKGNADMVFNGPDLTFSVDVKVDMDPLEGLTSETIEGTLLLSAKAGDEFAFLGCATELKLLSLIDNHGEVAIGVGLKNPRNREDLVSHYFAYAPANYITDVFSGVYLNVAAHLGVSRDDAVEFDLFVVSAKAWFEYGYNANLLLNFAENAYHIGFSGGFSVGVEACVLHIACVEIGVSVCLNVDGGRNNTDGWNFAASASGDAELGFGLGIGDCSPGCNEVVSFWDGCIGGAFKVCGNATISLSFSERKGLHFSASAGGSDTPCM